MKRIFLISIVVAIAVLTSFSLNEKNELTKKDKKPVTDTLITNAGGAGINLTITLTRGKTYNHPLIAVWTETMDEEYIQLLYVSKSIAKGNYEHGVEAQGKWLPGEKRRPAALPYWSHKRNVKEADGLFIPTAKTPIADAYSGPTPLNDFKLFTKTDDKPLKKFRLLFEINQAFDWNDHWHNALYPDDENYKTSCQPSVVYAVTIDPESDVKSYYLNPVGHGHYSGATGELFTDLSTLTTALEIVGKIEVNVVR